MDWTKAIAVIDNPLISTPESADLGGYLKQWGNNPMLSMSRITAVLNNVINKG